jgi:ribosomal protein S18 acetylase RimI-like enzyme
MAEEVDRGTIRNASEADQPKMLELLFRAFERWPAFAIDLPAIEHLRWKLRSDPIAQRHQWVSEIDQRIAAMILRILPRVRVRGRDYLARHDVDAAVDPDYQGRGLYRAMLDHIFESPRDGEFSLSFWFSTNPKTRRLGRASDGEPLGNPIQVLQRPYDPRAIVARRREKYGGRLPAPLAVLRIELARGLNRLLHPPYFRRARCDGSIAALERFDERIGGFFEEAARAFDFIVVRSTDYLNWRYCDPAAGRFTVRVAEREGRLLGYLVFKIAEGEGYITDLLALPGRSDVVRSLVEDALRIFRKAGVELVTCWMISRHPYNGILRRYGFFDSRRNVGCRYRTLGLDRSELEFLEDPHARIHVTHGDSDWV